MEFRILGPFEVLDERGPVALGGTKPRAVLAALLMHPNEPVSAERLALAVWGEDAPEGAVKAFAGVGGVLVADVGAEPGPELRRLQDAILHHDPALAPEAAPDLPQE